jgi:ABC-type antimicrobial peptide transport system permease subunit
VRTLFLKSGAWIVAGGLALGVPTSWWMGRLLANAVVRIDAFHAPTLLAMIAVLAAVALLASIVPASRAASVEPTTALRLE